MLVTILILCLFLIHITLAHDKCVLRLEDVDMPTFVIDLDRDIATNISVVSQDEISVNETACDLTDPAFFESLTFAYNISNLESVLAYARFIDSLNVTASHASLEKMINITHKPTMTAGELAVFVADLLEASFNNTQQYSASDVFYHVITVALRSIKNINVVIHNSTLAELDRVVYRGWEQMPRSFLVDNEIYRTIIEHNSVNNTLYTDAVFQRPYTIFEQFADAFVAAMFRSQPFDKYGFRRATIYELLSVAAASGGLANFKYQAKMLITQRISSLRSVPFKDAVWNGLSAMVRKFDETDNIFRPELLTYGGISRRFTEAVSTVSRSLPAAVGIISRAWYDGDEFRFSSVQRSIRNYESLVSSVQKLASTSSIEAASNHNLLIANLWKTMFLPPSSIDTSTQEPELFELADIFNSRYWWDPAGSWSGWAPTDRKVLRMSGLTILPIPADSIAFVLWWIKYFGRSTVFQAVFDFLAITNPFGNSTNSPFGATNVTLCLPAPGWFWPLPDPVFGCSPPQLGPAPVVFESTDAFLDYMLSMLVTNWTKYDPWLNPFDKIPAVLQLLTTSFLNETVSNNPPLATVITWFEAGVNLFWVPLGLMPFRLVNQNMPKYSWLTLIWVVPFALIILVLVVLLIYGTCVGYCIPTIGTIIALGDPAVTVTGGLAAQLKLASNVAFQRSLDGIKQSMKKASDDLAKYKKEQEEKKRKKAKAAAEAKEKERQMKERQAREVSSVTQAPKATVQPTGGKV